MLKHLQYDHSLKELGMTSRASKGENKPALPAAPVIKIVSFTFDGLHIWV